MSERIKVLFLAANPASTSRLKLDEELRSIEHMVQLSEYRDRIDLRSRWAVRAMDLLYALNKDRPQILHFSGHGGGASGLRFQADDGGVEPVRARGLARIIQAAGDNVRLVFLNACYSDEQASALETCVDCVIGMVDGINDDAAACFAATFYGALGFGKSVQTAFDQGLAALALKDLPDELVPRLRTRAGIDAKNIFLVPR